MGIYTQPLKGWRIKEGAPRIERPSKEALETFESLAQQHFDSVHQQQKQWLACSNHYQSELSFFKGKHVLIAGGTGSGLGAALVNALLHFCLDAKGSVCVLSRDLKQSFEFSMGRCFQRKVDELNLSHRFYWSNRGLNLDGKHFDELIQFYCSRHIDEIIYINTVASASSGLLPNYPPVYVKDVDELGLFQWKLTQLSSQAVERTRLVMGEMAVALVKALEQSQIHCQLSVFADWRGSLDKTSRLPSSQHYGRQGAYSTSLYLPKDVIQQYVQQCYLQNKMSAIDIFYPVMHTRALKLIPGGLLMASILDALYAKLGRQPVSVEHLAMQTLHCIYQNLKENNNNPFPRLDSHEIDVELWFNEVVQHINQDAGSSFFYRNWINVDSTKVS